MKQPSRKAIRIVKLQEERKQKRHLMLSCLTDSYASLVKIFQISLSTYIAVYCKKFRLQEVTKEKSLMEICKQTETEERTIKLPLCGVPPNPWASFGHESWKCLSSAEKQNWRKRKVRSMAGWLCRLLSLHEILFVQDNILPETCKRFRFYFPLLFSKPLFTVSLSLSSAARIVFSCFVRISLDILSG